MADLYLGFDLSTQQLKVIAIGSDLEAEYEEAVHFDNDLPHYKIHKGVHINSEENSVYAPVAMWVEALDLVLSRLQKKGLDFSRIKGISGAGQQHGSVFWSEHAETLLASLDAKKSLLEQLDPVAFTNPWSPNWQDHSTQTECDTFEKELEGEEVMARISGSKAHHRFTGPQILRFKTRQPEVYAKTPRISLVSSFLASLFLGKIAPIDISDVCGMNLWDLEKNEWSKKLLEVASAGEGAGLEKRLGEVENDGGKHLGNVSPYFVEKYGFSPKAVISPFTGDNPATILALPLRPRDVMISLGTSTTCLMSTPNYVTHSSYHMFNHPTTSGLYMFMLCYVNGALARESIRDTLPSPEGSDSWALFNETAANTPVLSKKSPSDPAKLGIYFPLPEIVPNVRKGIWRFNYDGKTLTETTEGWTIPQDDARAILESQALSMRLRSAPLLENTEGISQPRRVYVVGGASKNPVIPKIMGEVLGGAEGVYKLELGGNACALGAAYKAVYSVERKTGETFEDFLGARWKEEGKISRIADGYTEGVWEQYGEVLGPFVEAEEKILAGEERNQK